MGGAIDRVESDETAFGERSAAHLLAIDSNWTDPAENAENVAWVRETWSDIDARFGTDSTYLNFSGRVDELPDAGVDDALARNLRRLAEVKATYDADNLFRRNNNILPAAAVG